MTESAIPESDVENRSEIVVLYDFEDANPNGNPLSSNDRPRIDEDKRVAVITDVRFKRYLRDELDDSGYGIYIQNPSKHQRDVEMRDDAFLRLLDLSADELSEMDPAELFNTFLESAIPCVEPVF